MTRNELKCGKWYLFKNKDVFYLKKFKCGVNHLDPMIDFNSQQWVEIDPEMIFKMLACEIPICTDDAQRDKEAFGGE